jgi:hypothetical protein
MKKIYGILLIVLVTVANSCTKEGAKGLSSNTGTGGSLARFTIVGSHLYIVDKSDLKVFDITNASKPQLKNTVPVGFEIETIFPFKDKLFIGSTSMVHIFSIDNPALPVKLSEAISPDVMRRCDPVVAKDTVAYATLRTNGACGGAQSILAVYNIKDVLRPVQVTAIPVAEPYGLGYSGNALYVCDVRTLLVYDISNAFSPVLVRNLEEEAYIDVIAHDNTLVCWTKTGLTLYDITERLHPQLITKIS